MKIKMPIYEMTETDNRIDCQVSFFLKSDIFKEPVIGNRLIKKYNLKRTAYDTLVSGKINAFTICREPDVYDKNKGIRIAQIKANKQLFNLTRCITRDYIDYLEIKKNHFINLNLKNSNAYHCESAEFNNYHKPAELHQE